MANTIKQKRGTSDPGASDLVVGELAINTTDGGVFTKTDGGTVVEVGSGGGGASEINDLSDAVTADSGKTIGLGTGALANDDGSVNNATALGYNALNAQTTGNRNTGVGNTALQDLTTGYDNTALGYQAGQNITTGYSNVCLGKNSGGSFTTTNSNIAIGIDAASTSNSTTNSVVIGTSAGRGPGASNVVIGHEAKYQEDNFSRCVVLGYQAGFEVDGDDNVLIGYRAGYQLEDSSNNTFIGSGAADAITTGYSNVAIGKDALTTSTTGVYNCAVGTEALSLNTTVGQNAAFGVFAGRRATGGSNTFIGYSAGEGVSGSATGYYCTAVGEKSMENFTSGYDHTAVGYRSLRNVTTGVDNVSVGYQSGDAVTTGSSNTFLGHEAGGTFTTGSNCTALGHNAQPSSNTVSNEITLGDASVDSLRIPGLQSGATDEDVLTYDSTNGNITLKPKSVSSTSTFSSGTHNVDFTGIATNWTKIEVLFDNISTSNTNNILLQVGTSSGFIESGYDSHSAGIGSTAINGTTNGAGFGCRINGDNHTVTGAFTLTKFSTGGTNVMVLSNLSANRVDNDSSMYGRGHIEIDTSTGIDRVRLTTTGSDNFDKDGVVSVRAFY